MTPKNQDKRSSGGLFPGSCGAASFDGVPNSGIGSAALRRYSLGSHASDWKTVMIMRVEALSKSLLRDLGESSRYALVRRD
jgi:hypothetical protein